MIPFARVPDATEIANELDSRYTFAENNAIAGAAWDEALLTDEPYGETAALAVADRFLYVTGEIDPRDDEVRPRSLGFGIFVPRHAIRLAGPGLRLDSLQAFFVLGTEIAAVKDHELVRIGFPEFQRVTIDGNRASFTCTRNHDQDDPESEQPESLVCSHTRDARES